MMQIIKRFYFPAMAIIFAGLGLAALVPAWVIDRNDTELLFGFIQTTEPQVYIQLCIGTLALSASAINQEGYSRMMLYILTVITTALAIIGLPGLATAQSSFGLAINWAGEWLYVIVSAVSIYQIAGQKLKLLQK